MNCRICGTTQFRCTAILLSDRLVTLELSACVVVLMQHLPANREGRTVIPRAGESEAPAGFRSRRGRCREPAPVTSHYASFASYKAPRVHHAARRRGGVAARGSCAVDDAADPSDDSEPAADQGGGA